MKFVGADGSQVITLFAAEEIRPSGGLSPLELTQAIAERYTFASTPTIEDLFATDRTSTFRDGRLVAPGGNIAITDFLFGRTGFSIGAETTEYGERILADFFEWLRVRFKFRNLETIKPAVYTSNIVVEFDATVEKNISAIGKIAELCNSANPVFKENNAPLNLYSMRFAGDPARIASGGIMAISGDFIFERRVGKPFESNRYFCRGPLPTKQLIALMEKIEATMKAA